jgi:DnaK suppressor protein
MGVVDRVEQRVAAVDAEEERGVAQPRLQVHDDRLLLLAGEFDAAVDGEQYELDSQLATVESRELAAIDAALNRMRDGRYGTCESCEEPIPVARLQALPYATLCIECQRDEEQSGHGSAGALHRQRVTDERSREKPNPSNRQEMDLVQR